MSSPIYNPVTQNGDTDKGGKKENQTTDPEVDVMDTMCGYGPIRGGFLQSCANIGCFTGFYSIAALVTSTLTVYVDSQITTLERQFGFSSEQTGIIMAANDIGYLVCVLFVSYSANRLHIPRSLGFATVIFGISGIACSLPHFIFGARVNKDPTANIPGNMTSSMLGSPRHSSAVYGDMCGDRNDTRPSCAVKAESAGTWDQGNHVAMASLVIIVIGMFLQGFGKAPRSSFTITYVDGNTKKTNTGFYMGIIVTLGIFGPALAFMAGGVFSKMYVTLEATKLHPRHPRWIGAWWLGYIVFGCLALIIAIPLFCFPRQLPRKNKDDVSSPPQETLDTKPARTSTRHEKPRPSRNNMQALKPKFLIKHGKDFVSTLFRLWTNPVYICTCASSCFVIFMVSGSSAYSPKYLERMFHLPAYQANYIMAGKTLFAACVGTFVGGYLTKRLKMTAMKALKFIIFVVFISVIANASAFFFYCDQPTVHNWPGSSEACHAECECEDTSYFPICGEDGKTYYSPCFAGCTGLNKGVYHNCTCIPGGGATGGTCDYGCSNLYPYAVATALRSLFSTLSIIPKMIVYIRCVEDRDKSMAVGFSTFMTSLLGWLLGPIVFGRVIDGICTIWDIRCGIRGRCLLYDNDLFRLKLHAYGLVALGLSLLSLVLAYIYARCTGCLDSPDTGSKMAAVKLVVNGDGTGDGVAADGDVVARDGDGECGKEKGRDAETTMHNV